MDRLGNVTGYKKASVSPGPAVLDAVIEYDAFGREVRSTGPASDTMPFRFSTKYTDPESGLVYYGYRFYDPDRGRWVNRDPIGERGGENLYGMLSNDSENKFDYLGWVGTICINANCKGKDLSRMTYIAEHEPTGDPDPKFEGPKQLRRLPQPGFCLDADAIYFPGGGTKIPNTGSMQVDCACGSPVMDTGLYVNWWKFKFVEKAVGETLPGNWPGQIPLYPDKPSSPASFPLNPTPR